MKRKFGPCEVATLLLLLETFIGVVITQFLELDTKPEAAVSITTNSSQLKHRYVKDVPRLSEYSRTSCDLKNPCKFRGICRDVANGYECECYNSFYDNQIDGCRHERNHCESNPCSNGGMCEPIWGNYFCACPDKYHGRNCETENKNRINRTSRPLFLYDLEQYINSDCTSFLIFDGEVGSNFSFSYSTGKTHSVNFSGDTSFLEATIPLSVVKERIQSQVKDKVPTGKKMFYFPYRYPQKENVDNYEEVISLQVKNGGVEQFSGEYKVYIVPNPKVCLPHVVLQDCGKSSMDIRNWGRGKKYTIRGQVVRRCSEASKLTYSWGLYNLSKAVPYPLYRTLEGSDRRSNLQGLHGKTNEYNIKPYSMVYGVYGLELQVEEKTGGRGRKRHVDHDMCWFRIIPDPVIAELAGGNRQTISVTSKLILNATGSKDPNEPPGVRDHLIFSWTCSPKSAEVCKDLSAFQGHQVIELKPVIGVYTFTVTVSVNESKAPTIGMYPEKTLPASCSSMQEVHIMTGETTRLSIECIKNCGPQRQVSSSEVLYVKVVCSDECEGSDREGYYEWTAKDLTLNRELSLKNSTELGAGTDRLIIKENVLTPGNVYVVTVTGGINGRAAKQVTVRKPLHLEDKKCIIDPTEGITAVDYFSFSCDYPEDSSGFPLNFEIYQSPDPGKPETAVLISYTAKPGGTGLMLMAGQADSYRTKLSLRIEDHFGESIWKDIAEIIVKPLRESSNFTNATEAVRKLVSGEGGRKSLEAYVSDGDMSGAAMLTCALTTALDASEDVDDEEKWILKEQFVNALSQIPMYHESAVKQVASVLHLVLGLRKKEDSPIPHGTILTASGILKAVTSHLCLEVTESYKEMVLSTEELTNVTSLVMESSAILLSSMVTAVKMTLPEYPVYDDVDPTYIDNIESYEVASKTIIEVLENAGKAILHRLGEEQTAKVLDVGCITSWIKVDKPSNLAGKLIGLEKSGEGIKISRALAKAMENITDYIGIQVTFGCDNPFEWAPDSKDINTVFMLVNVWNKKTDEPLDMSGISEPINLYFTPHMSSSSSTEEVAEGNVTVPLAALDSSDMLEDCITVHKIPCKKGQTPYLKFKPMGDPFTKLQVVVTEGVRPSVEHFEKYSEMVPHSVSSVGQEGDNYVVRVDGMCQLDNTGFFVGVLPHPDTLEAAANIMNENGTLKVEYSFQVRTLECHVWNTKTLSWHNKGCQPGKETTLGQLHCHCSHFSVFAGSIFAAPSRIDAFLDMELHLVFDHNFVIPSLVLAILGLYCLLLMWAFWKDKQVAEQRKVTVLEDNYPGCCYAYLIAVYTGYKRNAGTTSNVAIQLVGDEDSSMVHILKDNSKKVHSRNSDNWFMLFTVRRLGTIKHIRLWHDGSGHCPSWYCSRVIVRDIQENEVWTFLVNRWLSVTHKGSSNDCVVHPATVEELYHWRLLFIEHVNLGFQEHHIWCNIFWRHPRSTYTRVQRLTVALIVIMMTMITSILLSGTVMHDPAEQLGETSLELFGREFLFAVVGAAITSPITFIFVFFFRKTAPSKGDCNNGTDIKLPAASAESPSDAQSAEIKPQEAEKKWWDSVLMFIMMEPLLSKKREPEDRSVSKSQGGDTGHHDMRQTSKHQKDRGCKEDDKLSSYLFAHQFVHVIWTLCILTIITCVIFLVLYGLNFGQSRSKMWVSAILAAFLFSFLVVQPFKVVIFALIHALLLKALKHHSRMRLRLSVRLVDICVYLIYITTLYWIVLGTRDDLAFYSTKSVEDIIVNSNIFREITSGEQFISYMSEVLIPALHQKKLYNHDAIKEAGVTAVYDTRLLGVVRLRQLRVKNGSCSVALKMSELHSRCGTEFSLSNEDTKNYSISWSPFDENLFRVTRGSVAWLYRTAWDSGTLPVQGEFAVYPGGGYITTLGRTLEKSLAVFRFLARHNWLDQLTRAIFIEFTTYNANTNLFNVVNLMVEMSAEGAVRLSQDIQTLKLLTDYHKLGMPILVATLLWLLMLFVFMGRQMVRFRNISLRSYFSSWWNMTDLVIALLGVSAVALYFLRSKYVSSLIKDLEQADGNEFVNYTLAAYWQVLLDYFVAMLVCLSTARLWKLLHFGHQFRSFERTLFVASHTLVPLTFVMLIITIGFSCFAHIFLGHFSYLFSKMYYSFSMMFFYTVGAGELDIDEFFNADCIIGPTFIIIYWLTFFIYLVNIFHTVIIIAYENSQKELHLIHEEYTMIDYLKEEIQYHWPCRRKKKPQEDAEIKPSLEERYPHYFKKTESLLLGAVTQEVNKQLLGQDALKQKEADKEQELGGSSKQKADTLWPQDKPNGKHTATRHIDQKQKLSEIKPEGELEQVLEDNNHRVLDCAENVPEPVYAAAVVTPKPDKIRLQNAEKMSLYRLEAMRLLALDTLQTDTDDWKHAAMAALTLDLTEESDSELNQNRAHVFFRGFDGKRQKLISDRRLKEMERIVNKIDAEKFSVQKEVNKIHESDMAVDVNVEQIMPLGVKCEESGVIDILGLKMDRLMTVVNEQTFVDDL